MLRAKVGGSVRDSDRVSLIGHLGLNFSNYPSTGKRLTNGLGDDVLHCLVPSEPDLRFCRMYIYIDLFDRHIDKQKCYGIHAVRQHRTIALDQASRNRLVTDESLIYEKILGVASGPSFTRGRDEARNFRNVLTTARYRQQAFEDTGTEYLKRPLAQVPGRRNGQHFSAVVRHRERDLRMCESVMRHDPREMIILGRLRTHKLPSGRRVEK